MVGLRAGAGGNVACWRLAASIPDGARGAAFLTALLAAVVLASAEPALWVDIGVFDGAPDLLALRLATPGFEVLDLDLAGSDLAASDLAASDLAIPDLPARDFEACGFAASGLAACDAVALGLVASDLADCGFAALGLAASNLEASDLEDSDLEDLGLEGLDLEVSGLDLAASGWAGVSANAGNPMASTRFAAKVIDKIIDKAVDRKAAARADWVTAFLRGESSISLGTRSI
jgi:uncharacterized protein YjbI with pentapeptide repeats